MTPTDDLNAKIDALTAGVTAAEKALKAERDAVALADAKRDRQIRWWKRAVVAALLIGLGGVVVGIRGYTAASKANRATDEIVAVRAESRVASCHKDNEVLALVRNLAATSADANQFFGDLLVGDTPIEGELAVLYQQFQAGVVVPLDNIAAALDPRDCSPEGIEAYLSTTTVPATPATNSDPVPTDP